MSRLIDGDRLMMSLADWWYSSFGEDETEEAKAIRKVMDKVEESLDTFTVPQWIPCSEHQPTEDGEYITTVEDGEGMFVTSNDWRQDWKQWGFWSVDEEYDEVWRRVTNVVAWMELPEPWRA